MSTEVPERLREVAEHVYDGDEQKHTLRDLLGWFGQARRGSVVNRRIARALADQDVRTDPDFRSAYIDDTLTFKPSGVPDEEDEAGEREAVAGEVGEGGEASPGEDKSVPYIGQGVDRDGSLYQVRRFLTGEKMARGLEHINRDAPIERATTVMQMNDYSQLPVMQDKRTVNGLVSWQTIGRAYASGATPEHVRDCMKPESEVMVVKDTDSIFKLIEHVRAKEVALVCDEKNCIVTLFTAADLGDLYKDMSEPFLYLGEIENSIRAILEGGQFTKDELSEESGPDDAKDIKRMDDLTFGSYVRIAEKPENWERLNLNLDRKAFIDRLDEVREIRNAVMHFDPDGLTPEQVETLKLFAEFLRDLQ